MSCWFNPPANEFGNSVNGNVSTITYGPLIPSSKFCITCNGSRSNSYHNNCYTENNQKYCSIANCITANASNALVSCTLTAYPYETTTTSLTEETTESSNIINPIESRIEWRPLVKSNYYIIYTTQNKKKSTIYMASSTECKQTATIPILPDIPAYILVVGCNVDPVKDPNQAVNDKYKMEYKIHVSDPYTYVYENKTILRRRDKETPHSVIYEGSVIEGVCSRIKK